MKLLEEESTGRLEEAIQKMVDEDLNSEEVKLEVQQRLDAGRKRLVDVVAAQLKKEKEAALSDAREEEV